jgi:hypothetical protein
LTGYSIATFKVKIKNQKVKIHIKRERFRHGWSRRPRVFAWLFNNKKARRRE